MRDFVVRQGESIYEYHRSAQIFFWHRLGCRQQQVSCFRVELGLGEVGGDPVVDLAVTRANAGRGIARSDVAGCRTRSGHNARPAGIVDSVEEAYLEGRAWFASECSLLLRLGGRGFGEAQVAAERRRNFVASTLTSASRRHSFRSWPVSLNFISIQVSSALRIRGTV